ncbi:MAG: class I SAM-dependent methyltransferase [Planctomycetia bacterium]|nr:class I SAM-dependent methyltransferase [Planctomycetia bacterium]
MDGPFREPPQPVPSLAACYFYHTLELPGHGIVEGEWDLRPNLDAYLGGVEFQGQRVLEVGTASGGVAFHLERQGAEVIAFDLSPERCTDIVPFHGDDLAARTERTRKHLERIRNGFWLAHAALESRVRRAEGTVYEIPEALGPVDATTFGSVLLHLRDPFLALTSAARLTRRTLIVTELLQLRTWQRWLLKLSGTHGPVWLPDAQSGEPKHSWWYLPPELVRRWLNILGFTRARTTAHTQLFRGSPNQLYTIVAERK